MKPYYGAQTSYVTSQALPRLMQFLSWLNSCFSFCSQTLEHLIYLCAELKGILTSLVSRHIFVQQNQVSFRLRLLFPNRMESQTSTAPRMLHRQFIYAHCQKRETEVLYYKVKGSLKFCCFWTVNLNKLQRKKLLLKVNLGRIRGQKCQIFNEIMRYSSLQSVPNVDSFCMKASLLASLNASSCLN